MSEVYHGEEIKGIPGYYVNLETQDVWCRRLAIGRGGVECEKWTRIKKRKTNRTWHFVARVNNRQRNLSLKKAILSIKQNVPYNDVVTPSDDAKEYHGLAIPGIPDCYIDEKKHEVWGYTYWANTEGKVWRKKKLHKKCGVECFAFTDEHKSRWACFNKALFCAKNKIDYYNEELNHYFFIAEGKNVSPIDRGDHVSNARKMKKKIIAYERIPRIRAAIFALQLLEEAYNGNAKPLFDYVRKKKCSYIYILTASKYNLSMANAYAGYDFAMGKLVEEVSEGGSLIFNLDGWFLKTAYGAVMKEHIIKLRSLDISRMNSVECSTSAVS